MIAFMTVGNLTVSDETVSTLVSTLPRLGSGISRNVYALSESLVLKRDYNTGSGAGSCSTEVEAYESLIGTDAEPYIAKIYAHGDGWLVMERAEYLARDLPDQYGDEVTECRMALGRQGIGDLHGSNIGIFPGGIVKAIDYAFNQYDPSDVSETCNCVSCRVARGSVRVCVHCQDTTTNSDFSVCFGCKCEATDCDGNAEGTHLCESHKCGYWHKGNPNLPCSERKSRCEDHAETIRHEIPGQRRMIIAQHSWAQVWPHGIR